MCKRLYGIEIDVINLNSLDFNSDLSPLLLDLSDITQFPLCQAL